MPEALDTAIIEYYLRLVLKKRWLIIIPLCIAMGVGIYLAITSPRVYQAHTLILVEPQQVPSNYVKSIVTENIASRINTISQQIMSRTNLEKIMDEFHLFSDPQQKDLFKEDKLEALRKRIKIEVSGGRRRGNDTFSISYSGSDPQKTMRITNALATYFIDENLKVRESHATGTELFLDDELKSVRNSLQEIEEALRVYRTKYMGELPEQLESNLLILSRLQDQLTEKQKNLRETKTMMASVQQQAKSTPDFSAMDSLLALDSEDGTTGGDSLQIQELKDQLAKLKLRYTDRHPDVVRIKGLIAKLEAQSEADAAKSEPDKPQTAKEEDLLGGSNGFSFPNFQNIQLDEIRRDIGRQQAEIADMTQQIEEYQRRIENTPKREQELLSLKRDYDNIKSSYDSLVKRKLEAEIAVNMEKKQKGEQFRIIDHAALPEKPYSPKVERLFLFSVIGGLGFGAGLIFLLDLLNTSLKMAKDYEARFGLAVLATIPLLPNPRRRILHRINQGLTAVSLSVVAGLAAGFTVLVVKGIDPTLAFLRVYLGNL